MWIGREAMLHQHERDLRRALDRRAALRLASQARRNRRAIAIGRQRLPGPVRIGLRLGVVLGSRSVCGRSRPLTRWNAVWEPTSSRINPMVAGLFTRQSQGFGAPVDGSCRRFPNDGCGQGAARAPAKQGSRTRAFERNFAERGQLRTAVAAFVEGRAVVELSGEATGLAASARPQEDAKRPLSDRPWRTSFAAAVALSKGLLGLDRTVAGYWPRFVRHGKGGITVRQVLAHRTGILLGARVPAKARAPGGWLARALEEARPAWEPGTRQAHDDLTAFGITSALLGRTDPRRRSFEEFVTEEVTGPLGLQLPPAKACGVAAGAGAAYLSATGGGAEVSGVGKALGDVATGGARLGVSREVFADIIARPSPPSKGWGDVVLGGDLRCSVGFLKPSPSFPFGSSDRAFGIAGTKGMFAFADPDLGLGFCCVGIQPGSRFPAVRASGRCTMRCCDASANSCQIRRTRRERRCPTGEDP